MGSQKRKKMRTQGFYFGIYFCFGGGEPLPMVTNLYPAELWLFFPVLPRTIRWCAQRLHKEVNVRHRIALNGLQCGQKANHH